jgi:DNA polymerase III epsilon subunit-like protein
MILFYDTETTGKAQMNRPADDPAQPRIVQLAAILVDESAETPEEVGQLSVIIQPDGFVIPSEASAIHGITTETALKYGVSESAALHVFDQMLMRAEAAVAHNAAFDKLVLSRGSNSRAGKLANSFCTMLAMMDQCKLPGRYGSYKWPKLQEAYQHCFGCEFEGAHDALTDVRACKDVYFWLKGKEEAL